MTTPAGKLVAMAHANNCTSDINAWVNLFGECLSVFGVNICTEELYEMLFLHALQGDADCGGLLSYGFHSGEHNVGLSEGCPVFLHPTNAHFNLANFMRTHLYTAFGAMKLGMDILINQEKWKFPVFSVTVVYLKQKVLHKNSVFRTEYSIGYRKYCFKWRSLGNCITGRLSQRIRPLQFRRIFR